MLQLKHSSWSVSGKFWLTASRKMLRPPEPISESDERLSRSYDSALKDFSEIARQNDATVQNLRTAEIRRRDYYFNKLERDIREKLIREAWEVKS